MEKERHDTGKIEIHVSAARDALEILSGNPTSEDKQTALDTLRLTVEIAAHKALRIQELEAEISRLKKQIGIASAVEDLTGT